jgi:hypothetical protein
VTQRRLTILCVSGFGERLNDKSKFWLIAAALLLVPGVTVICRQWDTLTPADVRAADAAITYSYGQAALWHAMYALPVEERPTLLHLFIIAGVPRQPEWFQFYGTVWTMPSNVRGATCFNIDSIPASCGIHNESDKYINVNCRSWGLDHSSIQGDSRIRTQIVDAIRDLAGASSPEATS